MSTIPVYALNGEFLELDREKCWVSDRSRINLGKVCPRKRYLSYHSGPLGKGVEAARQGEDLALGTAVHWGLERLLLSDLSEPDLVRMGAEAALLQFRELAREGIDVQGDDFIWQVAPEAAQLLVDEQAAIAQGLVYAFGARQLEPLIAQYEVVSLEEEINWLLTESSQDETSRFGVFMSRPDAILRHRANGKLYVVSYKTAKKFEDDTIGRLECDPQRFTEGLAVQARYGEEIAGVLYFYLLKGNKWKDKDLGYKRYTSWLVRPWVNEQSAIGGLQPSNFAMEYEWFSPEDGKTHRLGKGWRRCDVWRELDDGMAQWLEWLDQGLVQPEMGRDWLRELVVDPVPVAWDAGQAERWLRGTRMSETQWIEKAEMSRDMNSPEMIDIAFPLYEHSCFNFKRPCGMLPICWRGETVEQAIASGRMKIRSFNHPQEAGEEGGYDE